MKRDTHDAIKDAFDQIQADDALKETTKQAVLAQIAQHATSESAASHAQSHTKQSRTRLSVLQRRLIPLAACLILVLVAAFGGYQIYTTPAAAISIDINPSLELNVNRFDRVVSVEAYNEDGQQLADSVDVINMDYADAVDAIMANNEVTTLLDNGELLTVSLACDDNTRADQMYAQLESCTAQHQNTACCRVSSEDMEEAHHQGLSFGKYQAYLEARSCDDSLTVEDAHHMTMRELHDIAGTHGNHGNGQGSANGRAAHQSSGSGQDAGYGSGHHGQHADD